jgi:hypothetical protein
MASVRISDELYGMVKEWINKNGNKYKHSSISSFVNNAIYSKLKELEEKGED